VSRRDRVDADVPVRTTIPNGGINSDNKGLSEIVRYEPITEERT